MQLELHNHFLNTGIDHILFLFSVLPNIPLCQFNNSTSLQITSDFNGQTHFKWKKLGGEKIEKSHMENTLSDDISCQSVKGTLERGEIQLLNSYIIRQPS